MKCGYVEIDNDGHVSQDCPHEATYTENCTAVTGVPVCADHRCRHAITLVEAERRKEARRIPSHWMAT